MSTSNVWFQHFHGSLTALGHEIVLPPFDVNDLFDNYAYFSAKAGMSLKF